MEYSFCEKTAKTIGTIDAQLCFRGSVSNPANTLFYTSSYFRRVCKNN